ncbi:hypothetical protein AC578_5365 [Pseudocercospora eumusae]|uniref:Nucleolar 27S pre-rRNA processing Urb2/Npa2 C-terminal domain-containing protein n=1 Tax=Pseudocercospora eumusae TaxID=321146 RepID=A0A139HKC1_9PEZI|nr:hypothetical protein AC578_5365 [Pseudocercospora eumusae]
MGGPTTTEARSLDRLKALDDIESLSSQLHEARQLCNHSSRAEMILRWLRAKLKTSSDARQSENSWNLLASCIRLLSAQRLAALLGSGSLMEIVETATAEPKLSIESICAITDLWQLLFERGQASGGAAVMSLLSTKSANAAFVWGNWMGHLRQHCEGDATFAKLITARSLLDLGLQIWHLRKRQPTDHELFNSHCLLPASMVLRLLSVGLDDNSSRKRKQGDVHFNPGTSYVHALEACIARHTILPARAAFFDRDQKQLQRSQRKGAAEASADLEDTLNAIGQTLVRDPSASIIEVVPLLFDIALRAVPTPTPRHRIQERPWLEKVFLTLHSLLENLKGSDRFRVIAEMVRRIRVHGISLPPKLVSQLANECFEMPSTGGSETEQSLAFELLAELIALDASAFANRVLAERVFSSVASVNAPRVIGSSKTRICLPIMRAFAKNRDLNTFMELWSARLKDPDPWSLWAGLAPSFADVLGESRTVDQILADIDRYSQGLSTTPISGAGALNELRADAIILDGILHGLRNEDLLDRAWQRIDVLLHKAFALTGFQEDAFSSFYVSLWQLLTSLFESWLPFVAQNMRSPANVAEVGSEILGSELFKLAVRRCKKLCDSTTSAQHLVACVCASFEHYREHDDFLKLCKKSAAALCKQPASCISALVKYPDVLMLLDDESIVALLDATSKTSAGSMTVVPLLPPGMLGMFVDSKISSLSTMTEKKAKSERTSNAASSSEQEVLDLLSSLPLGTFTAKQRGSAIDALSNPPSENSEHLKRLERRFAAILALLQYPSEGSELLAEPAVIWSLVQCFGESQKAIWTSGHDQLVAFDAMSLLCKISETIISLWLKSRAQNRDKLLKISSLAKQGLTTCLEKKFEISRNVIILLAGSVIGTLETADNDFLQEFAHRDPKVTQAFSQMVQGKTTQDVGIFLLEGLLKIPRSTLGDSSLNLSTIFMTEVSKKAFFDDPASFSTLQFACEARAAQLFCRYAEVDSLSMFQAIESVLKRDLSGQDYYAVLKAFEARLQSESSSFRLSIIEECLKDGPSHSAQALELQRCTITALTNEDFESPRQLAAFEILHHVLRQASSGGTLQERQLSLQTVRHILKDKSFMVNQFGVEETISTLHSILIEETESVSTIYLDICAIVGVLLTQSLGRVKGRYHLIVTLFQQLIIALFSSSTSSSRHSSALSRLLQTFCNPPHIPRKRNANNLIDESRKAKAYAGQYVQYILHHYCSQILTNPPSDDTVREALVPGIWAVIEAIETNSFENGIKSLSAAMNNSERAVLRSVYEEWQRRGKWEGT